MKFCKRIIFTLVVALCIMKSMPVLAVSCFNDLTPEQVEAMPWDEIKSYDFGPEMTLTGCLVRELRRIEENPNRINECAGCGYGGLSSTNYSNEHAMCMIILKKFNEQTGLNINAEIRKLSNVYCQVYVRYENPKNPNQHIGKIGEPFVLKNDGVEYYSSAWDFGSGKHAYITRYAEDNVYAYRGIVLEISAIAYLDDYGKVTDITFKKDTEFSANDNVMILVSNDSGEYLGWLNPNDVIC